MSALQHIVLDEWRFWKRTKLGATVLLIGAVLTLASVVINSIEINASSHARAHLQQSAEARFLEQPDRHPHRMVHYGHYVFRTPAPLSIIDPGVDAFTGTAIFLEGHRQNSAMFSEQRQSGGLTRFSSLTPSFLIQVLSPLFIIMMGYASLTREKEAGTLNIMITQGTSLLTIVFGKLLALMGGGLLFLIPLILASLWAGLQGESGVVSVSFITGYVIYTLIWASIVVTVSMLANKNSASFTLLISTWILLCILLPRLGSSAAMAWEPSPGKLETDFAVLEALRKLGDGHNASDPAFTQLKTNLLAQYEIEDIEDLPINFRGVVAEYSEKKLTLVLNTFADTRMQEELAQAQIARQFGWLSPAVAIRSFSTRIAGSSLETHHRFLREAEALRFKFVQSLNKVHQDNLDYDLDINRYKDAQTAQKARVDASNWEVLGSFRFSPETTDQRLSGSFGYFAQLIVWLVAVLAGLVVIARRDVL